MIVLGVTSEEGHDILHTELADSLTTLNSRIRQLPLRFLQIQDTFFDCIGDGKTIDYHIDSLIETMNTVDGLFFHKLVTVSFFLRSSWG
jgi:hypothetical protein